MTDTYWAEREGARWDVYGKQRGWMAQADTEDDARLIVAALTAMQAQQPAAAVPVCDGCNGRGEIGGGLGDGTYQTDPCPWCAPAQQPAAAVPEGYALVPVEPTEAMVEAGARWGIHGDFDADLSNGTKETCRRHAAGSWAAMLAAARKGE